MAEVVTLPNDVSVIAEPKAQSDTPDDFSIEEPVLAPETSTEPEKPLTEDIPGILGLNLLGEMGKASGMLRGWMRENHYDFTELTRMTSILVANQNETLINIGAAMLKQNSYMIYLLEKLFGEFEKAEDTEPLAETENSTL